MKAEGAAIKLEFGGTLMTVELSQKPKIVMENGNLVLKTNTLSVILALPCKATFQGSSSAIEDAVAFRNADEDKPINVFTIDGKKAGSLDNKQEMLSLKRGIYVVNGKKIIIK
jgi:hypothetical protein